MADIVVAFAIMAFSFFYLSTQENLAEWTRRFFQIFGFLTIISLIGIQMTGASEGFMVILLWVYTIFFVMLTLIDLIFLIRDTLMMVMEGV